MLTRTSAVVVLIIFAFLTLYSFAAASETFTGTVTDTMCGKKHMSPGKSDGDCTRECMKSKGEWTYGLVVGDKVFSLAGNNQEFDSLAGRRVTITGELIGKSLVVQRIVPAK